MAAYRQTVLTAFQEVEDNLAALRILEQEAAGEDLAVKAAEQSLDVVSFQFGELIRQAGLQLMELLMRKSSGSRRRTQREAAGSNRQPVGQGARLLCSHGTEGSHRAPRVRTTDDQEVRLGSYEMFNRGEPLTEYYQFWKFWNG